MLPQPPALGALVILCSLASSAARRVHTAATHQHRQASCFPADPQNTIADRLNAALSAPGATGLLIQLCPDTTYPINAPIKFAFPNQEITTQGFPGLELTHRALITVNGPANADGTGHTTAVDGSCTTCDSVRLTYVQINGNRGTGPLVGGGNIEFGGDNQNQVVQYVHSYNPRGWTCLHVAEGPFTCANILIANNDIGPCGSDAFQEWADGISLSCKFSTVTNNTVTGATDGGIVIFGSPGSHIFNNTIKADNAMLLGGINMVDYAPWSGDFTGTIVENNQILGGFATSVTNPVTGEGKNAEDTFIKIGIAMGARTWFGDKFGYSVNRGATVRNNVFQGAFGYVMAAAVLSDWTVTGNTVGTDVTFIGSVGPNCSATDATPTPEPFVFNSTQITNSNLQQEFVNRDADSLTCILPDNDDWWPYMPTIVSTSTAAASQTATSAQPTSTTGPSAGGSSSKTSSVPLALGIVFSVLAAGVASYILRAWYLRRNRKQRTLY